MAELSALKKSVGPRDNGDAWLAAWFWTDIWQGYAVAVAASWSLQSVVLLVACSSPSPFFC